MYIRVRNLDNKMSNVMLFNLLQTGRDIIYGLHCTILENLQG